MTLQVSSTHSAQGSLDTLGVRTEQTGEYDCGESLSACMNARLAGKVPLAVVLEGVSPKWQMNILQVLATPTSAPTTVEGHGIVQPLAFRISPDQARHLATQITELLGPELWPYIAREASEKIGLQVLCEAPCP